MQWTRRRVITLATLAGLAACTSPNPEPSTSPTSAGSTPGTTPLASTPSSSATPVPKLTDPGVARRVVDALRAAAGDQPVIKVDLTASSAELSVLVDGKAKTMAWSQNTITEVDSDIAYVGQTSFNPDTFAFDDLAQLFGIAGALSGSLSNQQLHIVDYNSGEVLMTVTTVPESRPVFFRADGSPIHDLDYTSQADITEGLRDAIGDRTQLAAAGYDEAQGLWADAPHPTDPGVMVRRIRPAKLPTFVTSRKQDAPEKLFSSVDVNPEVLAKLIKELPVKLGKQPPVSIKWTIDMQHGGTEPTITLEVGGQQVITDLEGRDITATINR